MSRHPINALSYCLIGTGICAWAFAGRSLVKNPDLQVPLNPFGINGSPYGEVLAMAMQGPIDTYFHGAMGTGVKQYSKNETPAAPRPQTMAPPVISDTGPKIFREPAPESKPTAKKSDRTKAKPTLSESFENFLASIGNLENVSTNPKATSEAHKLYLRRQTENKLRFAYQLDPAHYGNYNSLNLFLSEGIGTYPGSSQSLAQLAQETIEYCLKQEHDPRPALTAAAAATNVLQYMFTEDRKENITYTTAQMRQLLTILDYSIARYDALAKEWDKTGQWSLISKQRMNECEDRFSFICKIREACVKTILRLEGEHQPQASN
jgi:hypothetical protein